MQLSDWVYQLIGLDFNHARSDLATHPFTSGTAPEDIRVTTRIDENDLAMMFFSSIHEGGHALYEQGLGRNAYGLPEAEPCSLSVHESQSRIWENNVARGQAFWTYVRDTLARYYPDGLQGYDSAAVFRAVNRIEPSLIRISADELTYHFHIMLRFEIERAIMEGDAGVDDIPELWHEKVRSYLGLSIPDEAHGALQDIHWSLGAVGYFPTYSLGSLYAAQFYHYAHAANPDMEERFRQGDFSPLNRWLAQNIYAHGRLMDSPKLCEAATGEQLNPDYFLTYMRQKLQAVYNIQW
jgi:carboxypeptidase Taq